MTTTNASTLDSLDSTQFLRSDANDTATGTLTVRDIKLSAGYTLQRSDHHTGHLEGSYNNVGANSYKSGPIYTIGSSYNPTDAGLSNMYGVGYSHTNANFISFTGASGWGMYVAADGDARVWLGGSNGVIASTGAHYVGSNRVLTTADEGSGNGIDADTVDSLQASQFLRSDANDTLTQGSTTYFSGSWNDWLVRFQNNNGSNAYVLMSHHDHGMHIRNDSSTTSTYLLDVYGSTGNRLQVRGSDARTTLTGTYLLQTGLIHFDVKCTSGTSSGTIVFNSVQENVGSAYNSSNGRFTAPVAGVYSFSGAILQNNSGSQFDVNLRFNGSTHTKGTSMRCEMPGHSTIQISETIKMNANDYVDINVSSGSIHHGSYGNWVGWQGTLLG